MQVKDYFQGKGCVVTGAASGIGYALAEELLAAGAVVFMADRDQKKLTSALDKLSAYSSRVHSLEVDVTQEEQVKNMVQEAAARHGRLDVLFNNAGIPAALPIEQATLEHWRRVMDVNVWGVIYGIHYALPIMRKQGSGHIVSTSSIAGLMPFPFQALYCASKFAVAGLSESLRLELADEGIRFSVICPGEVVSAIWGTPVLGEPVEVQPPAHAIPAQEAAQAILEGLANNQGIIVLPERTSQLWRQYWKSPEGSEDFLRGMARERRASRPWEAVQKPVSGP